MMNKKVGFTLIELVTTVAIMALLAALITINAVNLRANARDTQRKEDLQTIKKAIELYIDDNGGKLPGEVIPGGSLQYNSFGSGANCVQTTNPNVPWIPNLTPKYIAVLPCDPINTQGGNSGNHYYNYTVHANFYRFPGHFGETIKFLYSLSAVLERPTGNGLNYNTESSSYGFYLEGGPE